MTDLNDTILDGCLQEFLGGTNPPDLTARILKAYDASQDILDGALEEALGGITPPDVAAPVLQLSLSAERRDPIEPRHVDAGRPASRAATGRRGYVAWASIALALAAVVCGMIGWDVWKNATSGEQSEIAQEVEVFGPPPAPSKPPPSDVAVGPIEKSQPTPPRRVESLPRPETIIEHQQELQDTPSVATQSVDPAGGSVASRERLTPAERRPVSPQPKSQVVQTVNASIRRSWESAGASPAPALAERQWCNRVYEKLIGRPAEHYEVATFVGDKSPEKRAKLVDRLLRDEWYTEDFAEHWAEVWSDILLATSDKRTNREGLTQFLRRSFADGEPLEKIATALVTATGSGAQDPAADRQAGKYNGAVNYLLAYGDRQGDQEAASAHVSRTFLGRAMECNQCHDAVAWRGFKQETFWEFNAFFRQMKVEAGGRLSDVDFPGQGSTPAEAEIYYALNNGRLKAAYPVFIDEAVDGFDAVPRSGHLADVNRREELAKLIVSSRLFRQAMVNRFWGELFGTGFTTPVDDLGPHNPASHPELLAELGDQFAAHEYDVRSLIEWIVLSEPFGLAPKVESMERGIGTQELFASFPVMPARGEPLESTLRLATSLHAAHSQLPIGAAATARVAPTTPGAPPAGISEVDRMLSVTRSEIHRASDESLFGQIFLGSKLSTDQKIQHMFFATVHRPPTKRERATINKLIEETSAAGPQAEIHAVDDALRYIWWSLLNSRDAR